MYIVELIIKKLLKINDNEDFDPPEQIEAQDYENCEHIFMPIDSTSEILSCTKCGFLIPKKELKNQNFFKN